MASGADLDVRFIGSASSVLSDGDIEAFISANDVQSRKLCVITSGGTQAALEKRMVRSLENFSSGTRGARMTEAILHADDYAVILLVRKGAVLPYANTFAVKKFSDALMFRPTEYGVELSCGTAKRATARLHKVISEKRLLVAEYVSVQEYILSLRHIAGAMKSRDMGRRLMICLAAAVSDFYIPEEHLSRHKLQAEAGELVLRLQEVPKCLGMLRHKWAPVDTYIVSFKLETDEALLVPKSRKAISTYGVDLVVGNILETRYEKVTLIDGECTKDILKKEGSEPIEVALMDWLVARNSKSKN